MANMGSEQANRAAKVAKLIETIDASARFYLFLDTSTAAFADSLAGMGAEWWRTIAKIADVNPPSDKTIAEVVAAYRARPAHIKTIAAGMGN